MKSIAKAFLGTCAAVAGAAAVFVTLQHTTLGRETNSLPQFNVQEAPVNRETRGVTSYAPIIKRAAPSVVNISSTRTVRMRQVPMIDPFRFFGPGFGGPSDQGQGGATRTMKEQSLGSGVIVSSDGYVLTANHVVQGSDPDGVKVQVTSTGKEYNAKIVGTDPPTDVAVLKIDAKELPAITIADSDKLQVGDVVLAIGQPFGLPHTVTMGIVSAVQRSLGIYGEGGYEDFIQTDAAINEGNSGGALIDAEGRLVGINTAIYSPSGGNAGIGFAVPVNMARGVMERLIKYGKVTRGYLGVNLSPDPLTPGLARQLRLPDQDGALITDVMPNSPASKAGLEDYDVVREIDGKKVKDSQQLRLYVAQQSPGEKVTMKVLRSKPGGRPSEQTITATLGTLPGNVARRSNSNPDDNNDTTSAHDALDGVEVTDIDANARRQFGIPANVRGALVTNVDENSPSAEAGLRQGDVIQEIDRQPVRDANAAVQLSDKAGDEKEVLLRVWRGQGGRGGSTVIVVQNPK